MKLIMPIVFDPIANAVWRHRLYQFEEETPQKEQTNWNWKQRHQRPLLIFKSNSAHAFVDRDEEVFFFVFLWFFWLFSLSFSLFSSFAMLEKRIHSRRNEYSNSSPLLPAELHSHSTATDEPMSSSENVHAYLTTCLWVWLSWELVRCQNGTNAKQKS